MKSIKVALIHITRGGRTCLSALVIIKILWHIFLITIPNNTKQWTISAITFIDVTKQYGVHSVGTLYRECMVKVAFHHE